MEAKKSYVDELSAMGLVDDERVKKSFIEAYSKIHKTSPEMAEMVYAKESVYYKKALNGSEKLRGCTKISLYSTFLEIAVQGLSIQPGGKGEAYLEARGVNIGTKTDRKYEDTCFFTITAYGELNLRIRSGQIVRAFNPQVIYENDLFQPKTDKGVLYVEYEPEFPRTSNKIVGCYVRLLLPGGHSDYKWLGLDDVKRLEEYSKKSGGFGNALYKSTEGGIDPGFLEAKTLKHSFRSYTKLYVGDNVAFEGDHVEETKTTETFSAPEEKETVTIVTNPDESF